MVLPGLAFILRGELMVINDPMEIEDNWDRLEWSIDQLLKKPTRFNEDYPEPKREVFVIGKRWIQFLRGLGSEFPEPCGIYPEPNGGIIICFKWQNAPWGYADCVDLEVPNEDDKLEMTVIYRDPGVRHKTFYFERDCEPHLPADIVLPPLP